MDEINNVTTTTNTDIEMVVDAASKAAEENVDIAIVRKSAEEAEKYEAAGVIPAKVNMPEDGNVVFLNGGLTAQPDDSEYSEEEGNKDLMDIISDVSENKSDDEFAENIKSSAVDKLDLSDEDANKILDCILTFRADNNADIYNHLPDTVKRSVDKLIMEAGLSPFKKNDIAKMMIAEFISEAETDQTFIDFEQELNRAMQIPSLTDLYNEHLSETMDKKIPAMADAIQNEDPEKAEQLRTIGKRFEMSISFADLYKQYDESAAIRKALRRDSSRWPKMAEVVDYVNVGTKFKMPKAADVGKILYRSLVSDTEITFEDIDKFLVLLFKSLDKYRSSDIVDTSYRYYILKNITMLEFANDKAKGTFSTELLSNIKSLMYYIRVKESEFNAANSRELHKPKRSQRKRK